MKFDAAPLSDHELVVLESALRVQLAVAKHVRVQQLTAAIGGVLLTGGASALLSGPSIVCSTVLRRKCQRRHRACLRELDARNVALAPIEETKFSKRALALSVASGLTCCVLGVALDVLVDAAVLQVVAFFFSSIVEDHVTQQTTGFVREHAAELVGRDQVYVLDVEEPFMLFGSASGSTTDAAGNAISRKKSRAKSLVDMPRRMWKNASWSFSSAEMQTKIRDAKRKYRNRRSLHESFRVATHKDAAADGDDDSNDSNDSMRGAGGSENWAFLFADDAAMTASCRPPGANDHEHETLFGCRVRATTLFGTALGAFEDDADGEAEMELVRSDAFSLFGDCYVVRVRQASAVAAGESLREQVVHLETSSDSCEDLFESKPAGARPAFADNPVIHVIPCGDDERSSAKSVLFSGDEASCAFWDGIWHVDDDEDDEAEYGVEVWGFGDADAGVEEEDAEYGVEVWEYGDDDDKTLFPVAESLAAPPVPADLFTKHVSSVAAVGSEEAGDAYSLFGPPKSLRVGVSAAYHRYETAPEDDAEVFRLFG